MISYSEALSHLIEVGRCLNLGIEDLPVLDSVGRILAASIYSPEDVPSFTNSAMDGFAVRAVDTLGATATHPIALPVRGLLAAGDLQAFEKAHAEHDGVPSSVEIMTGAPLPVGRYDAVARIEDVEVGRTYEGYAKSIKIFRPVKDGENIRSRGTDFAKGGKVAGADVRLTPEHVLAFTSLGISSVPVKKFPRVAIMSTGSELVSTEERRPPPGMIRNSTGPFLTAAFSRFGIEARNLGIVRDDPQLYRQTLEQVIAEGADLIVSTGAVSMGKYDFVCDVLKEMGATIYFHKVAIRPGKPLLFSELRAGGKKCMFFGVPGNPVSTAVGLRFFIEPFIRATLGLEGERAVQARLVKDCRKPEGLKCFFKGKARMGMGGLEVEALEGQASYIVSSLLAANCWVLLPELGTINRAGESVQVVPLQNAFEQGVLL